TDKERLHLVCIAIHEGDRVWGGFPVGEGAALLHLCGYSLKAHVSPKVLRRRDEYGDYFSKHSTSRYVDSESLRSHHRFTQFVFQRSTDSDDPSGISRLTGQVQ